MFAPNQNLVIRYLGYTSHLSLKERQPTNKELNDRVEPHNGFKVSLLATEFKLPTKHKEYQKH